MANGIVDNDYVLSSMDVGQGSDTAGNREDLLDFVTMVSPMETPFLSGLPSKAANGIRHEILVDELASFGNPENGNADVRATPEAIDASFSTPPVRKRMGNLTHILRKTVDVSDTQRSVVAAGVGDEYTYQLRKKIKELARETEFALVHSQLAEQAVVGNAGESPNLARKMEGLLAWCEPDPSDVSANYLSDDMEGTITEAGSPLARLTETILNDHLQRAYDKGMIYKTAYTNSIQKREISGFTANVTRNINADERRQINVVNVYESDFGTLAVMLHRYMPKRQIFFADEDYIAIAILRPVLAVELAKTGNTTRGMVEIELTLEVRMPAALGKITQCSNRYGAAA